MTAAEMKPADLRKAMRYIPKGSTLIEHPLGCCYIEDKQPSFLVMGYVGNAGKRAFYESYRRIEDRDKRVTEFLANLERSAQYKAERKAERAAPHALKVGEVVYNSWGYDQTNVDFYQIVKATAHFVWLQPVKCESVPSEGVAPMSGYIQPAQPFEQILTREVRDYGEYDEVAGQRPVTLKTVPVEPKMRKAEGRSVKFDHGCGTVWDGQPKYESWYA